jgi:hypothetical protein
METAGREPDGLITVQPERALEERIERPLPPGESGPGVTWRSVLLCLLLMPVNIWWVTIVEVRWYTLDGTCLPLFITPIFFLFVLALGNRLVAHWWRRAALRQGELLVIYIGLSLSCVFAGHDMLQNLFGAMGHAYEHATPENHWADRFLALIPDWLFLGRRPGDMTSLHAFYTGSANPYDPRLLLPWIPRLAAWAAFVMALVLVMLGMNVLLRRQWTENERLSFPLVQLPLAMTDNTGRLPFWTNRVMWAGFATAAGITMLNGFSHLYPSVPGIEVVKQYNIGQYFTTRPWSVLSSTNIALYPFAIGLGFFVPRDLLFSCWFFFVWRKTQEVLGEAWGMGGNENKGWPFFGEQSSGAWIALVLLLIWTNRRYFGEIARDALGQTNRLAPDERRRYRVAVVGIVVGLLFLQWFCMQMGMSFGIAALFLTIYFGLSLGITRVRAELGVPHEINFVSPAQIMLATIGTQALGIHNLTAIACMHWLNRGYRAHPMPNQLESFKMAQGGRINLDRLIALTVVLSLAAIVMVYWSNLDITFRAGAEAKADGFKRWVGAESFDRLNNWLSNPISRHGTQLGWTVAGGLFVAFLSAMRGAFIWWPFHPAGYALALSFAMDYFWFAFLVSWLIKLILVRYGGMRLHTTAAPYFLGLILGDYVSGSIWAIVGPVLHVTTYKIFI